MATQVLAPQSCVVRDTASRKGRTRSVDPRNAPTRYLHYGRIILHAGDSPARFGTNDREIFCVPAAETATRLRIDDCRLTIAD